MKAKAKTKPPVKPKPDAPSKGVSAARREGWFNKATTMLSKDFAKAGLELNPQIRCTCGWPSKGGTKKTGRVIGEVWDARHSADGTWEIFITPTVADPVAMLAILLHELCHISAGVGMGHGAEFKAIATALGLTGKMTATKPSDDLVITLTGYAEKLGEYPGAALTLFGDMGVPGAPRKPKEPRKGDPHFRGRRDKGRYRKFKCVKCQWQGQTTRKHIDAGMPTCHCGGAMEAELKPDDTDPPESDPEE